MPCLRCCACPYSLRACPCPAIPPAVFCLQTCTGSFPHARATLLRERRTQPITTWRMAPFKPECGCCKRRRMHVLQAPSAPMPVSPLAFGAPNARGRSVSNWSPLFGPLLRDLPLVSAPACASLQVGACPLFCLQLTGGMTCALLRGPAQMFLLAPTARHSSTHVQTVYSRGTATHGVGLPGPPSPARARALATPGARHVAPSAPAAGLPPRAQPRPSLSVPGRSRQLPQQLGPEAAALGTPARARRHTPNNTRVASPWDWAVPSP
jgi:hypothetical protein